jgi:hypothetical protein
MDWERIFHLRCSWEGFERRGGPHTTNALALYAAGRKVRNTNLGNNGANLGATRSRRHAPGVLGAATLDADNSFWINHPNRLRFGRLNHRRTRNT